MTHITSTSRTLNSFYLNAVLKSVSFSGLWAASRIHAFGTRHDRSNRWDPPPHLTPAFLVSRLYAPSPVCRCCTTLASASQPLLPIMCPLAINVLHSCFVSFFFSFFAREGAVVGEGDMTAMVQLLYFCNSQVKTAWWVEKGENI